MRLTLTTVGVSTLAFILLSACGGEDLSRSQTLGQLRVLAVIADKPEVQPGTVVQISPVVSFIENGGASLTHEAWGCLDPGISVGAVPTCDFSVDRVALLANTSLSLSGPYFTETLTNLFSFAVPSSALALFDSVTRYNGANYIVEYIVRASNGQVNRSIKRISVTEKALAAWNTNPTLTSILRTDGITLTTLPANKVSLYPNFPGASKQSYTFKTSSGVVTSSTESITVTWFVSRGTFEFDRTDSNGLNDYVPDGTAAVSMVVVLRDDRGGMAVRIINM